MSEQNDDRDLAELEPEQTPGLEPDEEEEAAEHDAQEAPAPAPPSSEAVLKKADAENRRYHKKLDSILGANSGHHECPACQGLGITWQQDAEAPDLVHPDNLETCDACNGYGEVITGSKNAAHYTTVCVKCSALGYITKAAAPTVVQLPPAPPPAADQPIGGQFVPGRGFIPYGATEPLPGTNFGVV
jgi:hypothetical protein